VADDVIGCYGREAASVVATGDVADVTVCDDVSR